MALQVRDVLFLLLLVVGRYRSSAQNDTAPSPTNEYDGHGSCLFRKCIIGPTFKRTGNCSSFSLEFVDITELSKEQFDRVTDGLTNLYMIGVNGGSMSVPTDLDHFSLIGTLEYDASPVTIDANSNYKLMSFELHNSPQLPANIGKLKSLKFFKCNNVHGRKIELTDFTQMFQLEKNHIFNNSGVILLDSLELPSLRQLSIVDSPMTVSDVALCKFPKLEHFYMGDNNLRAITAFDFSTFTNVRHFFFNNNKLRRVTLDIFANMSQLQILDLSSNLISEITIQNKVEFPNLSILSLRHNNLTELNFTQWFMPALASLSLSGNQLKQVPGLLQLPTAKIQVLLMDDNPWDCEWLMETVMHISGIQILNLKSSCYDYSSLEEY